ncbi:MAG: hypothetical protein H8D67_25810 [Deltaproteobacteria bacterium]|nr:hypothetical protein [Deltaproteobacteria bacterium]
MSQQQHTIAPQQHFQNKTFRITHPFHPLHNKKFEIYSIKKPHGESRVYFYNMKSRMVSVPLRWTDIGPPDPFVKIAAGRSFFRADDLIRLYNLIQNIKQAQSHEEEPCNNHV